VRAWSQNADHLRKAASRDDVAFTMTPTFAATDTANAAAAEGLRPCEQQLWSFGRTRPGRARVWAATREDHVAAALRAAPGPWLARGGGNSYGDAALNEGGEVLDTSALRAAPLLDTERGVLVASAGTTVRELLGASLPAGWMVPVVPGTGRVTVGGAIACDAHGKSHHRDASFGGHLAWVRLITPDGEVMRLTPGEPAFAATVGGNGLTGVVVQAAVKVRREEHAPGLHVDTERVEDLESALAALAATSRRYTIAWLDLLHSPRGRGVVTAADHGPAPPRRDPRPVTVPTAAAPALRNASMRAFNALYWARTPRRELGRPEALLRHLFPLDALACWNRLYGASGLIQYQLIVPPGAERTLREVIWVLHARRVPVYLATLKRMGARAPYSAAAPSEDPSLSFPMEGVTLALDFPARAPGLAAALDRCDELVAQAGGRVYFTKDVRLRPDVIAAMYPSLERWRAVRDGLDPAGRLRSDLGVRLGLVAP
jgi:decaprenylphospho-beta-D-ribofuranose 2-oxidase